MGVHHITLVAVALWISYGVSSSLALDICLTSLTTAPQKSLVFILYRTLRVSLILFFIIISTQAYLLCYFCKIVERNVHVQLDRGVFNT